MKEEQTIEEIRSIRKQISKKFNNNPNLLVRHYLDLQKKIGNQMRKNKDIDSVIVY